MPSTSEKQRGYMGAALARKRSGKRRKGDPKMSESQLADFASKKKGSVAGMLRKRYGG